MATKSRVQQLMEAYEIRHDSGWIQITFESSSFKFGSMKWVLNICKPPGNKAPNTFYFHSRKMILAKLNELIRVES